jgi:hypothetical protein
MKPSPPRPACGRSPAKPSANGLVARVYSSDASGVAPVALVPVHEPCGAIRLELGLDDGAHIIVRFAFCNVDLDRSIVRFQAHEEDDENWDP